MSVMFSESSNKWLIEFSWGVCQCFPSEVDINPTVIELCELCPDTWVLV